MISTLKDKRIMFTGPHGIGKTVTAKKFAINNGLNFFPSIASEVAKRLKYDMNASPGVHEIAAYQGELLIQLRNQYQMISTLPFTGGVFDRSPFDLAAYTGLQLEEEKSLEAWTESFLIDCMKLTRDQCDLLILPQADLDAPYDDKDKRPKFSREQIEFRKQYYEVVETLTNVTKDMVPCIIVPEKYQFDFRLAYIQAEVEKLAW